MDDLLQILVAGVTVGAVYALIALAFTMIYSATGILNFAQGELAMLGALLGVTVLDDHRLAYVPGLLVILGVAALVGAVYAEVVVKPLRRKHARLDTIIVATIAVSLLLRYGAERIWGTAEFAVPTPIKGEAIAVLGARINPQSFLVIGVAAAALIAVWVFFQRTVTGRTFRAVACDEQAATLLGISAGKVVTLVMMLSAALSALAGLLFTPISFASAHIGLALGFRGIVAAIVGGLGNPIGSVAAGFVLGVVEAYAAYHFTGWQDAVLFSVLLLVLFLKPSGLVGAHLAVREG